MICSKPFKHTVIDGFADPAVLDEIVSRWPKDGWTTNSHKNSSKKSMDRLGKMPNAAKELILLLNTQPYIDKFSLMLGRRLIPDPYITSEGRLWGGGLHEIQPGGFLGIHVDFNKHPLGVWRRANLLIYLNRDWEWGGDLELWGAEKEVSIKPVFNRAVLFETTETSWHGHPDSLDCPEDVSRKSIAIYYYSADGEAVEPHSTIYRET